MVKYFCILMLFLYLSIPSWQYKISSLEEDSPSHLNNSLHLSISSKKNQTGHSITQFAFNKTSKKIPSNWNAYFEQNTQENNRIQSLHILGTFIVPPKTPEKDVDTPMPPRSLKQLSGIGNYKFNESHKATFNEALYNCSSEDGHLAIINSEEEANIIKKLYAGQGLGAYLGFHDRIKEGEFVTIFGQPLKETGYSTWSSGEPNKNGCGCFFPDGLLRDCACEQELHFICEFPLSN